MIRKLAKALTITNSVSFRYISVWPKSHQNMFKVRTMYPFSVVMRKIQTNKVMFVKIFSENENLYAHKILESMGNYHLTSKNFVNVDLISQSDYNQLLNSDWSQMNSDNLLESFKKLSVYAGDKNIRISEMIFDKFIDAFTDKLINLTDSQLEEVFLNLKLWPETESAFDRNFVEVWAALDDVISERSVHWSNDKLLTFMDYACLLNLGRKMDYTWKGIWRASRLGCHLKPQEFVQFMYYAAIRRKTSIKMFPFQECFELVIDKLSIEEIAIASMGFFKTKSQLRSYFLIKTIVLRTIDEIDNLSSVSLTAILKIIRYSDPNELTIMELLEVLSEHVPRFSFLCSVHMALLCQRSKLYHYKLLKNITDKFVQHQDIARLKDLERLALTFSSFNDQTFGNVVYDVIVKQLRKPERQSEVMKHGRSYACCLLYLISMKVPDAELVSRALDENFLAVSYGLTPYTLGREILGLDTSVQIELSNYTGNRLSSNIYEKLAKRSMDYIPDENQPYILSYSEQTVLNVKLLLQKDRGGADFARCLHILPHFRKADIIIANDHEGNPVSLTTLMDWNSRKVHFKPTKDIWIVINISGKKDEQEGFNHYHRMKNRQLKTMGYIPVVIKVKEWDEVGLDEKDQLNYLHDKILTATRSSQSVSKCERKAIV